MDEKLNAFLEELAGSDLNATALRSIKKKFREGIDPIIKKAVGNPVSRKKARLKARLAKIQAEMDALGSNAEG